MAEVNPSGQGQAPNGEPQPQNNNLPNPNGRGEAVPAAVEDAVNQIIERLLAELAGQAGQEAPAALAERVDGGNNH